MGRRALNSADIKIEQKPAISDDPSQFDGDIVRVEQMPNKEYREELAFNEEPVTIVLHQSSDKNSANSYPIWNNGKGCEAMIGGKWREVTWLTTGTRYTIKRKYLEIMARSKMDNVETVILDKDAERPRNMINRVTSAHMSFSVLEDKNPRGADWLTNIIRQQL
jgi:hypothetical protein